MLLHFVKDDEYGFFFPDASDFDEHWEEALSNAEQDYHVQANLRSVFDWIEVAEGFGESPEDKVWNLIQNSSVDSKALLAAGAAAEASELGSREAYDNARAAIALLDEAYVNALENDWAAVALFCLKRLAALENTISSAGELEISRAVELIEILTSSPDVNLGNLADAIQLLLDNESVLDPSGAEEKRAFVLCIREANKLHNQGLFTQERSLLSHTIELAEILGIPTEDLEERYVETYRLRADQQADRGPSLEASELVESLEDQIVLDVLSTSEKEQWKSRLRSAVQKAAQELKRKGVTADSTYQRYLHQSSVDKHVRQFKHIKEVYDVQAALFWLLSDDELIPDFTDSDETYGIHSSISRMMYSQQGHLIEFDPNDTDLPARYAIHARITISTLVSVLSTLIKQGILFEADIYAYLNVLSRLDSDNQWYLTRFITNVFEGRDVEAIHLGASRIEPILYTLLREEGEDVDALLDEGTGTRTLGSLVPKLGEYVSEDFQEYIRNMYAEPVGQMFGGNIRNRVAHGLLLPPENNRLYSLIILADILRILTRMHPAEQKAMYGIPDTILLATNDTSPFFPLVVRSYYQSSLPEDEEFMQYISSRSPTVEEIADHFDIPYNLAIVRIRLSEASNDVTLDEDNQTVMVV